MPTETKLVPTEAKLGDLLANAITHGVGAVFALAAAAYLIVASTRGSERLIVSCSVYATTLFLVYLFSTLYHSMVRTRARHVFQILDHSAIYLLIAGTCTPFALVSLGGKAGWILFSVEWALAVGGVVFKSLAVDRFAVVSALLYLFQGWLVVFAAKPLLHSIGWHGMIWLIAGGVAYTLGVVFFAFDRLRYFHATWHVFVLSGSIAHFFAVLLYVVPPRV